MAVGRGGRRRHVRASLPRALRLRVPELAALKRELARERHRLRNCGAGRICARDRRSRPGARASPLSTSPRRGSIVRPGGGPYFAYGIAGVYDRQEDRWIVSGFPDYANSYSAPWERRTGRRATASSTGTGYPSDGCCGGPRSSSPRLAMRSRSRDRGRQLYRTPRRAAPPCRHRGLPARRIAGHARGTSAHHARRGERERLPSGLLRCRPRTGHSPRWDVAVLDPRESGRRPQRLGLARAPRPLQVTRPARPRLPR